jgi:hypothetical protein
MTIHKNMMGPLELFRRKRRMAGPHKERYFQVMNVRAGMDDPQNARMLAPNLSRKLIVPSWLEKRIPVELQNRSQSLPCTAPIDILIEDFELTQQQLLLYESLKT